MSCKFNEQLLYEYLDDLLDKDEQLIVNNHLSLCLECRKKIAEIKLLFYEIENLDDVDIPDELADIRMSVVNQAFIKTESSAKKTYNNVTSSYKKTANILLNIPVLNAIIPTKEKASSLATGVYNTGKKVYAVTKKERPDKKKKKIGGLI